MPLWVYAVCLVLGIGVYEVSKGLLRKIVVFKNEHWKILRTRRAKDHEISGAYHLVLFPGAAPGNYVCFHERGGDRKLGIALDEGLIVSQDVIAVTDPKTGELTFRSVTE
jgi:hypothetical protein